MNDSIGKSQLTEEIIKELKILYDPEIPINIYDLGMIYDVEIDDDNNVRILMTLTAPNCPVAESLPADVKKAVENGEWSKAKNKPDFNKMITEFEKLIGKNAEVLNKYSNASPSAKRRYSAFYFEAKTSETRKSRLDKIINALNDNGKGMLY